MFTFSFSVVHSLKCSDCQCCFLCTFFLFNKGVPWRKLPSTWFFFFFLHFPRIASRHTEICNIQINPVDGDDSIRIKFCLFKTETLQTELPSNESPCKDSQKLTPTGNSRLQPGLGINALIIPRVELMLSQTQTST